jgi:hypothetical protein
VILETVQSMRATRKALEAIKAKAEADWLATAPLRARIEALMRDYYIKTRSQQHHAEPHHQQILTPNDSSTDGSLNQDPETAAS